jgi:hypothetical protein
LRPFSIIYQTSSISFEGCYFVDRAKTKLMWHPATPSKKKKKKIRKFPENTIPVHFPSVSENFCPNQNLQTQTLRPQHTAAHASQQPPSTGDHADPTSCDLRSGFHPKILLAISIFPLPCPTLPNAGHKQHGPLSPTTMLTTPSRPPFPNLSTVSLSRRISLSLSP